MSGKAPKQKGDRLERLVVTTLREHGVCAKRVPLSGSAEGFKGDVIATLDGSDYQLECKSRKDFKTLYKWLNGNDALVLKGDRKAPLIVTPLGTLLKLYTETSYRGEGVNEL